MTAEAGDPGNDLIRQEAPALWLALSALGRRVRQPEDFLPQQSAEARGKPFNASIGQITDGHGHAVELPALGAALAGLPPAERSRGLLYSPLEGLPELRQRWRERQRRHWPAGTPSSLPLVTASPGLARQVLAELFVEEGRTVLLPGPPLPPGLEGARQLFELRRGARVRELPAGRYNCEALARELGSLPAGEPLLVLLAGGATAGANPEDLRDCLAAAAATRPVVVLIEDSEVDAAAADEVDAAGRLFALLAGGHALVPFRIEGTAKLGFPGAGLGFLTLPYEPDSRLARELEKKLKMLLRAAVGSPSALTQVLLLAAFGAE
jgi:DNA-binding transcriptional MocR family regulator